MFPALGKCLFASALAGCFAVAAFAQDPQTESTDESDSLDEIIVIGPKPGDRRRVDEDMRADAERTRILKEQYRMRVEQEEYEWRQKPVVEKPSRIKFGYDPRDDYKMRTELDMYSLPYEQHKPATLFRVEF